MSTRAKWYHPTMHFYEDTTHETVRPFAPLYFQDDFLGTALDVKWTKRDTGDATELVTAVGNGVLQLLLTNAVEVQLGGVDWNDVRSLVLNQGLMFEARVRFTTLPANASTAVVGLCGNHNAAINTVAESIWFRWNFSGDITVENDDTAGAHETSSVATGVTLGLNEYAIIKIDCTDIADVHFFINGERVAAATTFNMNTVPALLLQPVARMDKAANALNLGVMEVDYIRVWQERS